MTSFESRFRTRRGRKPGGNRERDSRCQGSPEAEFSDAGHGLQAYRRSRRTQSARLSEADATSKLSEVEKQLKNSEKYASELEEKLATAEVAGEVHAKEVQALQEQVDKLNAHVVANEGGASELRVKLEALEKEKYLMFKALMTQFDKEREELLDKYRRSQELLTSASKDVLHLHQENVDLKSKLRDAVTFEPRVKV